MDPTKIPIPSIFQDQLLGFMFFNDCWLFASEHYQVSYWMMLTREGFSGDLLSSSSELSHAFTFMDRTHFEAVYQLHHKQKPDHYWTASLRDDVETLILSGRIKVFRLDADKFSRLCNPEDVLYASRDAIDFQSENPVVAQRYELAEVLGKDIIDRWTKKDSEDRLHWDRFVLWREAYEIYDVGAEAVDTVGDFAVGLWDIGCFVIEISYEVAKIQIKLTVKAAEILGKLSTGDVEALKKDLADAGVWLDANVKTAKDLMAKAEEGARIFTELAGDPLTRALIYDYLDSLYQSIPYRDSRTLLLRLVFEIGLEVLIALATFGAGNVARRAGQATAATTKAVRTSSVTKRIGPFTERAIDVMADLGRVLRKPAIKHEPPPVQKLDVPNYAKPVKTDSKKSTIDDGKVEVVPNSLDDAARVSSRPEWLRRLDAGNDFNRAQSPNYPYNEVYVNKPDGSGYYRLDSYNPNSGEIVSRKFTQFSDVQESTSLNYINEIQKKYPAGAQISNVPTNIQNGFVGQRLQGQKILEVPVQNNPIPQSVIDAANDAGVLIRDIDGRIY